MANNMNDPDMDMTTNRSKAGAGAANNEEGKEQAAEGAKQQNANENETGSHREGQYDKQSDKPTMRPGNE